MPIPVIMDSKIDNEQEKKRDESRKNPELIQNSLAKNAVLDDGVKEKPLAVDIGNSDLQAGRQINAGWPKVQHGVQEIGDEPHHLGRLAG